MKKFFNLPIIFYFFIINIRKYIYIFSQNIFSMDDLVPGEKNYLHDSNYDSFKSGYQGQHYCLTIFNYETDGYEYPQRFHDMGCIYFVYGKEICPDTQKKHLQCYVVLNKKKKWNAMRNMVKPNHVKPKYAKSLPSQAANYCKKDGDFFEWGVIPKDNVGANGGKATAQKWIDAKEQAKSGNLEDIDPQIFICHYNTLKRIRTDYQERPADLTWVDETDCPNIWYWGPRNTSKSHTARLEPDFYSKPISKWWCGYNDEPIVLIEDIDTTHGFMGYFLKIWADKYHFRAEPKQGSILVRPKVIKVTSNYHPDMIWKDANILDPILRRFKIVHMTTVYKPPPKVVNDIIQITDEESCSDTEIFPSLDNIINDIPSLDDIILNKTSVIKK